MFDRLGFLVGEALIALRRNGTLAFAAISTVAVSLFLIGGLGYLYYQTDQYAKTLPGKFEMRVFLKQGTSLEGVQKTAAQLRAIPGVGPVSWIPRDKAWAKMRKDSPALTEGLDNPYPDAFKVTIADLHRGDAIAQAVRGLSAVDPSPNAVSYLRDEQRFLDELLQVFKLVGGVVGGLLFVVAGVLIYNAIRLTVLSRRLEIRIMQLVGASRFTIHVPFVIEGIVQGTIGGIIATGLLFGGNYFLGEFLRSFAALSNLPQFPLLDMLMLLTLTGAAYGIVCSELALRARLQYR